MFYGRSDCFTNLTKELREQLEWERDKNPPEEYIFRVYYGWMILPLAVADLILIPLFLIVVSKAMRRHRVSRKCYLLLANRSVDDLLSSIVQLCCCIYVITAQKVEGERVMLFFSMYIGSFWSGMVCYVGISLLKLFAVWKPIKHKKWFNMRNCIHIIAISWVVYILMFAYGVGGALILDIPHMVEKWSCRAETCLRTVWRSRHYITVGVYVIILAVFCVTVLIIKKHRDRSARITIKSSTDSTKSHSKLQRRFPLWKLGLNIATFAICQGVYVAWCLLNISISDSCFMVRHAPKMILPFAFVVFSLTLRVFVDHLLHFITDQQLRRYLFRLFCIGEVSFFDSQTSTNGKEQQADPRVIVHVSSMKPSPAISHRSAVLRHSVPCRFPNKVDV